ncbi:hypothetical protein PIB30_013657 [Stylosanthes scabra]|uniref:Uncharacterized protein n=1 Tax=Stylosanthes scabra TaxID=79078 RepID=A0ABU6V4Y4_9FABA|nr:hypothetical protein [Stylosanthes scabra]
MYNECLCNDAEKMALIEELGFGAFSHLPCYNLRQHMLKELVNIYDIHDNTIHSVRGDVEITTDKIGKTLGLSWNEIKKAKLNKTKAVHGGCYVMMIIYFHETHFGKNSREPEAQPPWIQYWTGKNLIKRLHREQNHPTGLIKTGLLRTAKEKLLKRNMDLKMGVNIMRKYPYSSESESEFDSEEEYEFEVESSSGGPSPELDSENTMSEELVERRAFPNPTPAQQERRSKKKQDSSATGGLRSEDRPLVEKALGKRKQPDRAAKSKNPNQGKPLPPRPQAHPQPQRDRAAKKARKPTHDDRVERASDYAEKTPQTHPSPQPHPERTPMTTPTQKRQLLMSKQQSCVDIIPYILVRVFDIIRFRLQPQTPEPPPPQYEELIDISSSSEDENQPPPPQIKITKTEEANLPTEEAQPQQSQAVVEQPIVPKEEQDVETSPRSQIISSVLVSIRCDHQTLEPPSFDLGVEPPLLTPQTMDAIDDIDDHLKKNPELLRTPDPLGTFDILADMEKRVAI